jgi:glycosyltransferase involved in cell wall biosynthesis
MRIAYTYDQLLKCGGTRVAFEHCRELNRRGHQAAIYANLVDSQMTDWIDRYQVRPLMLSNFTPQDVIISCWWRQLDQIVELPAAKHFHLVQGRDKLSYADGHQWREESDRAMHRLDVDYLAVSDWAGDSCRNPHIVPNGVDKNYWRPASFTKLFNDKFVIMLEASTSDPYKGLPEALEVVDRIKKNNPHRKILCWLVSRETMPGSVVDQTILNPNDVEILHAYQNCDCLLKATWFDGFGLPHLEAMSCGLPLVTTNAGGNMEFCRNDTNCLVAKPRDVDTLTAHVQSLIDSKQLRERLAQGGLLTAHKWSWVRSVDKLLEAIE